MKKPEFEPSALNNCASCPSEPWYLDLLEFFLTGGFKWYLFVVLTYISLTVKDSEHLKYIY